MEFYPSAAAAEEAGFRPCLRCFPEHSPRFVFRQGGSEIVSRALKLIGNDNELDAETGIAAIADRLGISDRHLRRVFSEQLGASPLAVVRTRRIQIAKQMITGSRMTITQIAFASGFQSLRQFNGAFKQLYGMPPSHIRRIRQNGLTPKQPKFETQTVLSPAL